MAARKNSSDCDHHKERQSSDYSVRRTLKLLHVRPRTVQLGNLRSGVVEHSSSEEVALLIDLAKVGSTSNQR
jgi:hypothetical protein